MALVSVGLRTELGDDMYGIQMEQSECQAAVAGGVWVWEAWVDLRSLLLMGCASTPRHHLQYSRGNFQVRIITEHVQNRDVVTIRWHYE